MEFEALQQAAGHPDNIAERGEIGAEQKILERISPSVESWRALETVEL